MSVRIVQGLLLAALAGCAALGGTGTDPPRTYLLTLATPHRPAPGQALPALMVSTPRAWPGFDEPRIAYIQHPLRIDYYASNEWADPPPRMLEPLLVAALEARFGTVVSSRSGITAELRLDTEIVKLQQEFLTRPSQGRVMLRAQLIDLSRGRVLGTQSFEARAVAPSDDAAGGVRALDGALQQVLSELVEYCRNLAAGGAAGAAQRR